MTRHAGANQLDARSIGVSRDNQAASALTVIALAKYFSPPGEPTPEVLYREIPPRRHVTSASRKPVKLCTFLFSWGLQDSLLAPQLLPSTVEEGWGGPRRQRDAVGWVCGRVM